MAKAPDFRLCIVAADERIIRGRRTVRRDPDDLAEVVAEILRLIAGGKMLAQGCEQIAVIGLHDAATIVIARRQRALLAEDDFEVVEPAAAVVQLCPRQCGTAAATGALR